jgi:hypothetical protein
VDAAAGDVRLALQVGDVGTPGDGLGDGAQIAHGPVDPLGAVEAGERSRLVRPFGAS